MGGVEDQLGRAVVPLQLHDGRVRVVPLEVEDVADVGAAPAIDRLVVVADDGEVAVFRRQRPDPQVLRPVRVLVLVDVEVAPSILVPGEDLRRPVEQLDRLEQEVVEIERADLAETLLVADGEAGDRPLVEVDGVLAEERCVEHLVLRPADRAEHRARAELAGQGQVLLPEELLHQARLVLGVVDDEPPVDADRLAVPAEDPRAQRVERPGLDVAPGLADEADDPLAQLARGTVGERHGEDRPRPDVLDADQVGDPVGQHPRLAGSGAGEDQERALGRGHGALLLGIQATGDLSRAGSGPGRSLRPLGVLEGAPLVGGQLVRQVARLGSFAQPVGHCRRDGRSLRRGIGNVGASLDRRLVGEAADTPPTGRGTHVVIVGCDPSRRPISALGERSL